MRTEKLDAVLSYLVCIKGYTKDKKTIQDEIVY